MKFSTTLLSALAPVALAKAVHNHYPRDKRTQGVAGAEVLAGSGLSGFGISANALTEVVIIWVNQGGGAATTTINQQVTVTQTVTAGAGGAVATSAATTVAQGATGTVAAGAGQTHAVTVGGPAGLVFVPDSIKANVGDMVIFTFLAQNHTATQSAFDTPCVALAGGMDSGFQANPNNTVSPAPQVAMQVMVDTPLWFFCSQNGHCGKGMTFSINPSAAKTQAMFQALAISQNGTGTPSGITGGNGGNAGNGTAASSSAGAVASSTLAALPGLQTTATGGAVATGTNSGVVQGTGTVQPDGSCACAVVVGVGAFPAVNAQGVGNFGGMAGALPATMAEAI